MTSEVEYLSNRRQAEDQVQGLRWLGKLIDHRSSTAFPNALDDRIENRMDYELSLIHI